MDRGSEREMRGRREEGRGGGREGEEREGEGERGGERERGSEEKRREGEGEEGRESERGRGRGRGRGRKIGTGTGEAWETSALTVLLTLDTVGPQVAARGAWGRRRGERGLGD